MYTELCLELKWLISYREAIVVDSMLCFSFALFIFEKKMYKIEQILPAASSFTHLISTEMKVI